MSHNCPFTIIIPSQLEFEQKFDAIISLGKRFCRERLEEGNPIPIKELSKLLNDQLKGTYINIEVNESFVREYLLERDRAVKLDTTTNCLVPIKEKCI